MPPKKRKRQPTQSQRQSQKVIVNIGSKSAPRKKSGRGGLPPPSYQHNLAPTFVTAPQVDYTPLLAMMQHHARPIVEQQPMPITQTPLSATIRATNAEQMAGEAAIRRAGPTAANFQPPPSQADERLAQQIQDYDDTLARTVFERKQKSEDLSVPIAESRVVGQPIQAEVALSKTPPRQQQQTSEKRDIKDIIDKKLKSGEPLSQAEMSKAMLPSSQIGKSRKKKLIKAGYTQFE